MTIRALLGEVMDVASGQVDPRVEPYIDMPHVGGDNIQSGSGRLIGLRTARDLNLISGKYEFGPDDVLYSKIRPALNKVALPDFAGICSADMYPLRPRPDKIERRYLAYLLRQDAFLSYADKHSSRTNIPKINRDALLSYEVRLPSTTAQRRIADILDKADAIRRKRKEAIALTEELLRSTFLEMFGDPVTNPKGWPMYSFRELLTRPLRNGVSPASDGRYEARVLTLSAITHGKFDPIQSKKGGFSAAPSSEVRVDGRDLLICRGNGNRELVGRGVFPTKSDPSVVFPDTMIAARIDSDRVSPAFLASCWNSRGVRLQLEASARTTNGTFKVNQGAIEGVNVMCPPKNLQDEYQEVANRVAGLIASHSRASVESDKLFNSLVARAFSGGLNAVC